MKIASIMIVLSLLCSPVYATTCPQPVMLLEKGQDAPCKGFFFSPEKEKEVRIKTISYEEIMEMTKLHIQKQEILKEQLLLTTKEAKKERQKAELWRVRAETSTERLIENEDRFWMRDGFFFGSGIAMTVLSAWAVGQDSK